MMKINCKSNKGLVIATIEEQKKRNLIDKPIAEIEESDSDNENVQKK
jgi:hypothetical protein